MHLLGAGTGLPVALRARRPLLAWQICLVSVVVASGWFRPLFQEVPFVPTQVIAYVLCLYAVASRHSWAVTIGAWLWSLAGIVIVAMGPPLGPQAAIVWSWSVVFVTLPLVFAHNVGTRRRAERALDEQERRNRREQAERARLEERSRIARELHDVVAHNMSVIAIQAEAAPLKAGDDAGALAGELADIRATALETLTEMRRVLDLLHTRDASADTVPAPGVDQLDALVERVGAAGVDVDLTIAGTAHPVAPGVGVSVYRIVQESLSNALRHAPGAKVAVELNYRDAPRALVVRVENGPPPAAPPVDEWNGARHGLVGMRERAAMLHGVLRAQPTDAGGFVVEATLPLEAP
jgi:signal transduction histidine kinase